MSAPVLVCFAVPQEAAPFRKIVRARKDVRLLITGMGGRNAERSLRAALDELRPSRVFTCGFAGALDPALQIGDVVCASGTPVPNARPVTFACAEQVAITAAEKSGLRERTGADAVEMESAVIERICRDFGIQCIVLRAISDSAGEDLPLDFNRLMTAGEKLSSWKLALAILQSPQKIPALLRLGRNSALAARRLAEVLATVI